VHFDAVNDDDPARYAAFVEWLVDATVEALKSAKGDPPRVRAAVEEYLTRGYAASLTSDELTDFFCTDTPGILDRAGFDGVDAEEAVAAFDGINPAQCRTRWGKTP
jgi:hypothetical protein